MDSVECVVVGAGVVGSAVGMDKVISKELAALAGVPVLPHVVVRAHEKGAMGPLLKKALKMGLAGKVRIALAEKTAATASRAPSGASRRTWGGQGGPDIGHQFQIEVRVVDAQHAQAEDIAHVQQVPQVGAGEMAAGETIAERYAASHPGLAAQAAGFLIQAERVGRGVVALAHLGGGEVVAVAKRVRQVLLPDRHAVHDEPPGLGHVLERWTLTPGRPLASEVAAGIESQEEVRHEGRDRNGLLEAFRVRAVGEGVEGRGRLIHEHPVRLVQDHAGEGHPLLQHASLHASLIGGGTELSTYPDKCRIELERRTLPIVRQALYFRRWDLGA